VANILADTVLDNGLSTITANAAKIYICTQDPATYTEASSTYALGVKDFGAGAAFGAAGAASPNGRKVSSSAITDGSVTGTGTAAKWAVTGAAATLYANGSLSASQAVTSGNTFTLGSFDIRIPNQ
jgi:hypothetical protein